MPIPTSATANTFWPSRHQCAATRRAEQGDQPGDGQADQGGDRRGVTEPEEHARAATGCRCRAARPYACRPPDRPPKNTTVSADSTTAPIAVNDDEADHGGERGPALADQEREDHEQRRGQLDRRGQPDQRALGDPAPLPRRVGQQVGDHQGHQQGVHLAVAEGGADRLQGEHHGDADQRRASSRAAHRSAEHRLLGPDQAGGPDHLPEHVRTDGERDHQHRGDRRVDEVQPPERRRGGVDVAAGQHVADRVDVDLQIDGRRLARATGFPYWMMNGKITKATTNGGRNSTAARPSRGTVRQLTRQPGSAGRPTPARPPAPRPG